MKRSAFCLLATVVVAGLVFFAPIKVEIQWDKLPFNGTAEVSMEELKEKNRDKWLSKLRQKDKEAWKTAVVEDSDRYAPPTWETSLEFTQSRYDDRYDELREKRLGWNWAEVNESEIRRVIDEFGKLWDEYPDHDPTARQILHVYRGWFRHVYHVEDNPAKAKRIYDEGLKVVRKIEERYNKRDNGRIMTWAKRFRELKKYLSI